MPTLSVKRPILAQLFVVVLAALALAAGHAHAGPPEGFVVRTLVSGLSQPTSFERAPDGRIFIAQKSGLIRVWRDGALSTYLDMRGEVNAYSDRGLLGIALDPAFATNRWVYVVYTVESDAANPDRLTPTTNRLIRVRSTAAAPGVADPGS
ncbi:MAG TPA: PQQ-dependent sugar dehydrogenase, partial [Miltoncostaeaceae bacterium]|nr:PQQ-dependent sugar dehydrogenase [Miltoncostaeaceae bacterium]